MGELVAFEGSQSGFAAATGIPQPTVSRWVTGRVGRVSEAHRYAVLRYIVKHRADQAAVLHQRAEDAAARHPRRGERLKLRKAVEAMIADRRREMERAAVLRADPGTRMPEADYLERLQRRMQTEFKWPELLSASQRQERQRLKAEIRALTERRAHAEAEWREAVEEPPEVTAIRRRDCKEARKWDTIEKGVRAATRRRPRQAKADFP